MKPRNFFLHSGVFKEHWPFLAILCAAAVFLFADLGGDYLWADEGDTAVLASSILKYGVPKAWDGVTFTDGDFGERLNEDLVMVSHPWLQYYVTAASFFVLGENTFAARFPFALAGLLTIAVMYVLILRITSDKRAALSTCILLTLSIQFLLYSRQCRNYSLYMLLACLMILQFFRLTNWKTSLAFSSLSIGLFHCSPAGLAPLGALAVLTLFYAPCREYRRWFWISTPLTAVFTLPWFLFATSGYRQNTNFIHDWKIFFPRLLQFFIECASVAPLVGVIGLFFFVWIRQRRQRSKNKDSRPVRSLNKGRKMKSSWPLFEPGARTFMVVAAVIFLSCGILLTLTQSRSEMWSFGLRYATPLLPLTMGMIGILISKASGSNAKIWIALMLVFGVTKFGRITPWSFLDEKRPFFDGSEMVALHVPDGWINKIFRASFISFSKELWSDNRGTVAYLCEFLKTNAAPQDILITNFEWEPLYFHTRLPQGVKIMPEWSIYETARKHGLPDYVFTVKDARWIVWRPMWEGYREPRWETLCRALLDSGATITKVASVPETTWENRENLHFRRFPGDDYKFSWTSKEDPDAQIFRVDWPAQQTSATQTDPPS